MRECGLKYHKSISGNFELIRVTPLAGVWIEIGVLDVLKGTIIVTPLAGVWIEIPGHTVNGLL